jgi:hypothetical protein
VFAVVDLNLKVKMKVCRVILHSHQLVLLGERRTGIIFFTSELGTSDSDCSIVADATESAHIITYGIIYRRPPVEG